MCTIEPVVCFDLQFFFRKKKICGGVFDLSDSGFFSCYFEPIKLNVLFKDVDFDDRCVGDGKGRRVFFFFFFERKKRS